MTGYCKWCDTLTDDIVQGFDIIANVLVCVWSGCRDCHEKRDEMRNNAEKKQ